jgi:FtsH-binding integral membrane protein
MLRTISRRVVVKNPIFNPTNLSVFVNRGKYFRPIGIKLMSTQNNFSDQKINLISKENKEEAATNEPTLAQHAYNTGAVNFLRRVYNTTGLGIFGGLATAEMMHLSGLATAYPLATLGIGLLGGFGSIYAMGKIKYTVKKNNYGYYSEQPDSRKLAYGGLCLSMGAMISPMVTMIAEISPTIFPLAIGLSATTMAGASLYAYLRPHNALSLWRAPLMGCLTSLVFMNLTSLASMLILGPNMVSDLWMNIDAYGGILLFSGMTAFDTYNAIEMYKKQNPDHIGCATDLYLNFMNLLIRFMEILAKIKKD